MDRFLTSVNGSVNGYSARVRKTALLRQTFTVTDEAFALLQVANYHRRWVRMLKASGIQRGMQDDGEDCAKDDSEGGEKERESVKGEEKGEEDNVEEEDKENFPVLDKKSQREDPYFAALYTSSQNGKLSCGWSKEGIEKFNEYIEHVKNARADETRGTVAEKALRNYWLGNRGKGVERELKEVEEVVEAYIEGDLFPTEV